MGSQEIITLQLGELSNFIGAHWWNLQDSSNFPNSDCCGDDVDNGVNFLNVRLKNGPKLTPRLIAVDIKGHLDFPDQTKEFPLHVPNVDHELDQCQGLPCTASEYLSTYDNHQWRSAINYDLNPKSVYLLPGFQHSNSAQNFNIFPIGTQAMEKETNADCVENQIRYFVEECDYFQGFQLLVDADNAFGGVGSHLLKLIKEEYPNQFVYAIPSFSPLGFDRNSRKAECLTNMGLLLDSLFENASMFNIISLDPDWCSNNSRKFSHLQYQSNSPYETGAILATALDAITMPLRSNIYKQNLRDIERSLVCRDRKAIGLSCAIPNLSEEFIHEGFGVESLNLASKHIVSLTPGIESFKDCYAQNLVWRGVSNVSQFQQTVERWSALKKEHRTTRNFSFSSMCYPIKPYKNLLVNSSENFMSHMKVPFSTYGGLHSSLSIGNSLKQLYTKISKINVKKLQSFLSSGMEEDDLLENRDRIVYYSELYTAV